MAQIEKNLKSFAPSRKYTKKSFLSEYDFISLSRLFFIGINKRNVSTMGLAQTAWDGCKFSHYFVSKQYFEMPIFSVTLANFQVQLAVKVDELLQVLVPPRLGEVADFSRRNDLVDQFVRPAKSGLANKLKGVVRGEPALEDESSDLGCSVYYQ